MISENIAGSILATQTQRQQWYKEFNTGCSHGDKLNLKTLFAEKNHLHAILCQETSDLKQEDKEQNTCLSAYFIRQ